MADGFIVRRGGKVSEQALAPTITEVSVTDSSITFTLKNNDTETATIVYRIDDLTAEGESISLAGGATSSNITASGLDDDTEYIVFATANVTGKVKSNVTQLAIETDPTPVYTAATGGTTNEYNLDGKRYKSHTFTSNGTFTVTTAGNGDRNQVDYLIIAGGGGGGFAVGGGAGGYRTTNGTSGGPNPTTESKVTVTATSYGVTIGSGGVQDSSSGSNSSVAFATTITSTGGGRGGLSGGSGGGENTGTAGEGFDGGVRQTGNSRPGGGGAGELGADNSSNNGGKGGDGLANLLRTGSNETRGGGGGGGGSTSGGAGGAGGGGAGAVGTGSAGTANTGGGGGGGWTTASGNGGTGIVVIRYEIAPTT